MKTMTEAEWTATHPDYAQVWTTERTDLPNWAEIRHLHMGKRTLMHHGELLIEGSSLTITPNPPVDNKKPVFLRDMAEALEKWLYAQSDTSLHWVAVVDEVSFGKAPTKLWQFNDHLLQVAVAQGFSEGSLIYVHAQDDRYKPGQVTALFRIKMLCSAKKAFDEAKFVYAFFESKEFADMTGQK
jgi:hypothetical protein